MLSVVRTDQAETDLAEILDYAEERSPQVAERLARVIDDTCTLLSQLPLMGRTREELSPGLRSVVIEQYVLFYRATATAVEVVRILHGARDIATIMKTD
jgi:toxin ParE1/3/4